MDLDNEGSGNSFKAGKRERRTEIQKLKAFLDWVGEEKQFESQGIFVACTNIPCRGSETGQGLKPAEDPG